MKPPRKGRGGALIYQIRPDEKRVVAIRANITPGEVQRMLKSRLVAHRELCALQGQGILLYARAYRDQGDYYHMPRWKLGPAEPVAGYSLLLGKNAAGQAASCPLTLDFVERNITWLPSQAQESANLKEAARATSRLAAMSGGGAAKP